MSKVSSNNGDKTVAIHQPNYLPWIGYFHKMAHCNTFVYLDDVQYPRGQSFANRNKIKTANGTQWLTIPISVPSGNKGKATYREVTFAGNKWKGKHLKTIKLNYKKAPYFDEIYEILEYCISNNDSFVNLNIELNNAIKEYLGIESKTVLLSEILDEAGDKTQLIVDICKELKADTYLSGTGGGKEYNDPELLNKNDISLQYDDFKHPEYPQLWDGFESHMSVIDLLFNCGPDSPDIMGLDRN